MEPNVSIELFGRTYTFRPDADGRNAREIAEYVSNEIERVASQSKESAAPLSQQVILLMAALNITDRFFKSREDQRGFMDGVARRFGCLSARLDAGMNHEGRPSDGWPQNVRPALLPPTGAAEAME